jgi:hypothetical protein
MAQGTDRRQGTPDSLVGASEITPVLPQTPSLQVSNASVPDVVNSPSANLLKGIKQWSSKKLQEAANVQHEARVLDGQMAYQQGKAMEDMDMNGDLFGDKWAMQGYRVMQAQTTASTMLAAQQEMIRQSQYEQDPEQFRATYINRLEQQLDGMDPQTATMVREQMAEHMPTLVAQQTTAYMANEEQNAFDTLAASIEVTANDPTAFDTLISNAKGGEGSASAGLSPDRTRTAVVAGVVSAFNNGSPLAYHKLKVSGLLDELPDKEREAVKAAKKRWETEVRSTYDAEHEASLVQWERDIAVGKADVDDLIAIWAKRGLDITAAEGHAAMLGKRIADDYGNRADLALLQAAVARGDLETVSKLTEEIVKSYDAGPAVVMNNKGATTKRKGDLSPKLLSTLNNVLPKFGLTFEVFSGGQPKANGRNASERVGTTRHDGGNAADGFFYKDGRKLDPTNNKADAALASKAIAELKAAGLTGFGSGEGYMQTGSVHLGYGNDHDDHDDQTHDAPVAVWGKNNLGVNAASWLVTAVRTPGPNGSGEAWADNVARYKGDLTAAAIAHRTDQTTADKWLANGKSWDGISPSVRAYAEGITASANGDDLYYTNAERFSMAKTELQTAQALRDKVMEASKEAVVLASTDAYNLSMTDVGEQLRAGTITAKEYLAQSNTQLEKFNLDLTSAISTGRVGDINTGIAAARSRAEQKVRDAESEQEKVDAADRLNRIAKYDIETSLLTNLFLNEIKRPGVTAEEIIAAESVYRKGVSQKARDYGLESKDTSYAAIVKTATDGTRAARVALAKREADQVLIDHAVKTGTVGDLSQKLQNEAFKQSTTKVVADVANAQATGTLQEADVNVAAQQALLGTYIQAGTVPKDVRDTASAIMSRELTDTQGNPNPQQLEVMQQWHTLRETNPEVARTMLDEAGRIRAEAVLEMAGGEFSSPEAIQQAMVATQRNIDGKLALVTGVPAVDNQNLINASQKAANAFMGEEGFGWVQGLKGNTDIMQTFSRTASEEASLFSEEAYQVLGDRVTQEAIRLSKVSPGQNADFYAKMAGANILERTALVGGSMLTMDRGYSLAEQMFGDAAGDMAKVGVENEVILSAIIDLAANNPTQFGFATDTTVSEQLGWASEGFWGATNFVSELFGGPGNSGNAISGEDARQSVIRGARPYIVETYDNQKVGIRVLRPDGNYSAPLPIDLGEAGAKYRKAHIDSLTGE